MTRTQRLRGQDGSHHDHQLKVLGQGRSLLSAWALSTLPGRKLALKTATRLEGGPMLSVTLRRFLQARFGVEVGLHSYGSLLEPGRADRYTQIGRYVSVGPGVRRIGAAHPLDRISMHPYWYRREFGYVAAHDDVARTPCVIGHEVWIGADAIILPGCQRIGNGAVIGAGSIVTRDIDDFSIVAGNPARVIGERLDAATRRKLLHDEPWLMEPAEYDTYISGNDRRQEDSS